jgi:hypothetical protein
VPEVALMCHKENDPPPFPNSNIFFHDNSGTWTVVVVEKGMASGEPSVAVMVDTENGKIILETSLLAFNAAAKALVAMAETNFNWTMPP